MKEVVIMDTNEGTKNEKQTHSKDFTIENLFNMMTRFYLAQLRRENLHRDNNIQNIYEMTIRTIEKKIKEEPDKADYYSKMYDVADRFYKLITDPVVREEIIQNNIREPDFMRLYREAILGDQKRKYDMSDLFRADYIAPAVDKKTGEKKRKTVYMKQTHPQHEYLDAKGNKVIIEEIGKLYMEHWNGLRSDISKYRIQRQIGENQYLVNEVFSNIRICDMEDPAYRDALFQELLTDNNMSLANAGGYIGEIVRTPTELLDASVGTERVLAGSSYFYRINSKYSLKYEGTDLSAVMIHDAEKKSQEKKKTEKFIEIMPEVNDGDEGR